MAKKLQISLLLFLLLCGLANAQREGDSFAIGYCHYMYSHGCIEPYGSSIYTFDENGIDTIIEPAGLNLNTDYSRATFSDNTTGELIFASNGWRLVNRSGEVLSYKLWRSDLEAPNTSNDTANLLYTQNPLFLPDPGDSTKAYLFYGQYRSANLFGTGNRWCDVLFTYAYLDIPSQSLISQGNVVITDTTGIGGLAAVRHGNGRDWWIVKPGRFQDEYYMGLLDPTGVRFEKKTIAEVEHLEQGRPCSYFSKDGDIFVHFTGSALCNIHRYSFDRCDGSFSNYEIHTVRDSVWSGDWMAPALSGDGSKFYFRRSSFPFGTSGAGGFYQLDFETEQIHKLSIFNFGSQILSNFNQIIQGSVVYNQAGDSVYMVYNLISLPDSAGLACQYELNVDTVLNVPNFIAPSAMVNFRLGKLAGSSCDTVVIKPPAPKPDNLLVFPNPTQGLLQITLPNDTSAYTATLFSLTGQRLYRAELLGAQHSLNLSMLNIAHGLYFLTLEAVNTGDQRTFKVMYTQ